MVAELPYNVAYRTTSPDPQVAATDNSSDTLALEGDGYLVVGGDVLASSAAAMCWVGLCCSVLCAMTLPLYLGGPVSGCKLCQEMPPVQDLIACLFSGELPCPRLLSELWRCSYFAVIRNHMCHKSSPDCTLITYAKNN